MENPWLLTSKHIKGLKTKKAHSISTTATNDSNISAKIMSLMM